MSPLFPVVLCVQVFIPLFLVYRLAVPDSLPATRSPRSHHSSLSPPRQSLPLSSLHNYGRGMECKLMRSKLPLFLNRPYCPVLRMDMNLLVAAFS